MSRCLNRAELLGYLGQDPEVRSTSGGTRVANLSLATNRSWKDRQGREQERTTWHRLVAWEGLAEICEKYLSKGDRLYVEGRIEKRDWTDDDGRDRTTTQVVVDNLIMLGSSSSSGSRSRSGGGGRNRSQDAGPGKPTEEDKRIPGATEGDGDYREFSDDALMGDDDLPF